MIFVGIDDTDTLETRGTNYLAREIARRAADRWTCRWILRHQLLFDSRIPYTSHNGSASLTFEPRGDAGLADLIDLCRHTMQEWFVPGSDPGLCVTETVPDEVREFGLRCQREIVTQAEPRALAASAGISLEGLGGTEGGVIGALAAVGLAVTRDDGRIIQWQSWPDDLSGPQSVSELKARDVAVREEHQSTDLHSGVVDVGKHLRPNLRGGRAVLTVRRTANDLLAAVKLP